MPSGLDAKSKKVKPYIIETKHQVLTLTYPTYDGFPFHAKVPIVDKKGKVRG